MNFVKFNILLLFFAILPSEDTSQLSTVIVPLLCLSSPCENFGSCVDMPNNYSCQCYPGYKQNGPYSCVATCDVPNCQKCSSPNVCSICNSEYNLIAKTCQAGVVACTTVENTFSPFGKVQVDITTQDACQSACIVTRCLFGYDFNPKASTGQQCWFSTSADTELVPGTSHTNCFSLITSIPPISTTTNPLTNIISEETTTIITTLPSTTTISPTTSQLSTIVDSTLLGTTNSQSTTTTTSILSSPLISKTVNPPTSTISEDTTTILKTFPLTTTISPTKSQLSTTVDSTILSNTNSQSMTTTIRILSSPLIFTTVNSPTSTINKDTTTILTTFPLTNTISPTTSQLSTTVDSTILSNTNSQSTTTTIRILSSPLISTTVNPPTSTINKDTTTITKTLPTTTTIIPTTSQLSTIISSILLSTTNSHLTTTTNNILLSPFMTLAGATISNDTITIIKTSTPTTTISPTISQISTIIDLLLCLSSPCENFGSCVDMPNNYSCQCYAGYEQNGSYSCVDIDECLFSPCNSSGTCSNLIGAYDCLCAAGFYGVNCERQIIGIAKIPLPIVSEDDFVYRGLLAGGSRIIVNGNNFFYHQVLSVLFAPAVNSSLNFLRGRIEPNSKTNTSFKVLTPAATGNSEIYLNNNFRMTIEFQNNLTLSGTRLFKFAQNPTVSSLKPEKPLLTGGVNIDVHGHDFNHTSNIYLIFNVTIVKYPPYDTSTESKAKRSVDDILYTDVFRDSANIVIADQVDNTPTPSSIVLWTFSSVTKCDATNDTLTVCLFALTNVSSAITNQLTSSQVYISSNIGVTFDNFNKYKNINQYLPQLGLTIRSPNLPPFTDLYPPFDPQINSTLKIKGDNLNIGCMIGDYTIKVGNRVCPNMQLTVNQLTCLTPVIEPTANILADKHSCISIHSYALIISISDQKHFICCLSYPNETSKVILIACLVAGGVLLLIITLIVIVVVVFLNKKKANKTDNKSNRQHNVLDWDFFLYGKRKKRRVDNKNVVLVKGNKETSNYKRDLNTVRRAKRKNRKGETDEPVEVNSLYEVNLENNNGYRISLNDDVSGDNRICLNMDCYVIHETNSNKDNNDDNDINYESYLNNDNNETNVNGIISPQRLKPDLNSNANKPNKPNNNDLNEESRKYIATDLYEYSSKDFKSDLEKKFDQFFKSDLNDNRRRNFKSDLSKMNNKAVQVGSRTDVNKSKIKAVPVASENELSNYKFDLKYKNTIESLKMLNRNNERKKPEEDVEVIPTYERNLEGHAEIVSIYEGILGEHTDINAIYESNLGKQAGINSIYERTLENVEINYINKGNLEGTKINSIYGNLEDVEINYTYEGNLENTDDYRRSLNDNISGD